MSDATSDDRFLVARTWTNSGTAYIFPEQAHGVLPAASNVGVCFSGGGARTHVATVGQLRGLTALGLLQRVRYISCVSGSSWPCTPFTYYAGPASDGALLGAVVQPEQLSLDTIRQIDAPCLLITATSDFQATLIRLAEHLETPPDQLWIRTVGETFLAPYGLFDADRPACFSLNDASVAAIRRANPQLADVPFHTVRAGAPRPYLVTTSCLVWPDNLLEAEQFISCEYTPLYAGSPLLQTLQSKVLGFTRTRTIGGGFIEPFAFGSDAPIAGPDGDGLVRVPRPGRLFTLADASGTSSSAYSALVDHLDFTLLSPHVSCWPLTGKDAVRAEPCVFADGGSLENLGVIALLRRKVERLIVFVNTHAPLNPGYDPATEPGPQDLDAAVAELFGLATSNALCNRVFSQEGFVRVVRGLQSAKRTGGAVMATTDLEVQDNAWWGLVGGWTVRICWVYNDRVPAWEARLPTAIGQLIDQGQLPTPTGPLPDFPHYKTDFENRHELVQLTPEQASLLAHLSCSNVIDNAAAFEQLLASDES